MEELKPCPFCGGEAKLAENKRDIPFSCGEENIFFVICENCGCNPFRVSIENLYYRNESGKVKERLQKEALEAWNRRA